MKKCLFLLVIFCLQYSNNSVAFMEKNKEENYLKTCFSFNLDEIRGSRKKAHSFKHQFAKQYPDAKEPLSILKSAGEIATFIEGYLAKKILEKILEKQDDCLVQKEIEEKWEKLKQLAAEKNNPKKMNELTEICRQLAQQDDNKNFKYKAMLILAEKLFEDNHKKEALAYTAEIIRASQTPDEKQYISLVTIALAKEINTKITSLSIPVEPKGQKKRISLFKKLLKINNDTKKSFDDIFNNLLLSTEISENDWRTFEEKRLFFAICAGQACLDLTHEYKIKYENENKKFEAKLNKYYDLAKEHFNLIINFDLKKIIKKEALIKTTMYKILAHEFLADFFSFKIIVSEPETEDVRQIIINYRDAIKKIKESNDILQKIYPKEEIEKIWTRTMNKLKNIISAFYSPELQDPENKPDKEK